MDRDDSLHFDANDAQASEKHREKTGRGIVYADGVDIRILSISAEINGMILCEILLLR